MENRIFESFKNHLHNKVNELKDVAINQYKSVDDYLKDAEVGDILWLGYDFNNFKRAKVNDLIEIVDIKNDELIIKNYKDKSKKTYKLGADSYDQIAILINPEYISEINDNTEGESLFFVWWKGKKHEIWATSLYGAKLKAIEQFKIPKSKQSSIAISSADSYDKGDFMFDDENLGQEVSESFAIDKQWVKKELLDFNKKRNPKHTDFIELTETLINHLNVKLKDGHKETLTQYLHDLWEYTESFEKREFDRIIEIILSYQ